MSRLYIETWIAAPADVCFDLMRDIGIHTQTTSQTKEMAVAGVTDGMIGLGQTVTFEGIHFGIKQRLTVKVVEFDRPRRFVDAMVEGSFRSFVHIHEFEPLDKGTIMRDTLIWESPFGILGRIFDAMVLERHLKDLLETRNSRRKKLAEYERDH